MGENFQNAGFKIKTRRGNKFLGELLICPILGFFFNGFKTKPRRRGQFAENVLIGMSLCFYQKPVSKLNLGGENKFRGKFISLSEFRFLPKSRF